MYKTEVTSIKTKKGMHEYEKKVCIIVRCLKLTTGSYIKIPHPISEFIIKTSESLNSARAKANTVTAFLNFIIQEANDKNSLFEGIRHRGLSALTWVHAAEYLNYCNYALDNKLSTVKAKENVLIQLYAYLDRLKILEDITIKYTTAVIKGKVMELVNAPFHHPESYVMYPNRYKNGKEKLKNLDLKHWRLFLEFTKKFAPEITLGVYFQMMGGLRTGEVVNLDIHSVDLDTKHEDIKLNIKDRQDILFKGRIINQKNSEVKKPRSNQIVLNPFGDLMDFYNEHLDLVDKIKTKTKSNSTALFVNNQGLAMTGDSYRNRFNIVKREFLSYLDKIADEKFDYYNNTTWSTHIGRGIFTNFIISQGICNINGVPNERLLADLRGDKSVDSARTYIDTHTLIENIRISVERLKSTLMSLDERYDFKQYSKVS